MWPDNEADRDFLNFTGVADTVAEVIVQAKGRPISIGVSGAWGVGKSSMIKLVRQSLDHRSGKEKKEKEDNQFVFVEFNAWLFQGYDDARAALRSAPKAQRSNRGTGRLPQSLEVNHDKYDSG